MNGKNWCGMLESLLLGMLLIGMVYGTGRLYVHYLQYGGQKEERSAELGETEQKADGQKEEDGEQQDLAELEQKRTSEGVKLEWKQSDADQLIRVCICTTDFESRIHQKLVLSGSEGFELKRQKNDEITQKVSQQLYESTEIEIETEIETEIEIETEDSKHLFDTETSEIKTVEAGEAVEISAEQMEKGEVWKAVPKGTAGLRVDSISRTQGIPEYEGVLYLCRTAEGIVLINELPLETYLYSVTASEMPSSYPLEAQKAQAVCARTYAVNCISRRTQEETLAEAAKGWQTGGDFAQCELWDLDDSVEFQVYNNQKVMKNSRKAVEDTAGEILDRTEVLYYSTSVGSETREDLGTESAFSEFLSGSPEEGAEYDSPWLRWQVELNQTDILERLKQDQSMESPLTLRVLQRNGQGQVQKLAVVCAEKEIVIEGEYQIRRLLAPEHTVVRLKDGTTVQNMTMLPSAYFILQTAETDEITLCGGGYGHGIGMSQCGAAAMAEKGKDYREILEYYYGAAVF